MDRLNLCDSGANALSLSSEFYKTLLERINNS